MYTINIYEIKTVNIGKITGEEINEFVDFWSSYYDYSVSPITSGKKDKDSEIDYITELNIGNDLTEKNLQRLLRWKSPRHLTHIKLSGNDKGNENEKYTAIKSKLQELNDFRREDIDKTEFKEETYEIFDNGVVYRAFLFNIAKPWEYPICDRNVFESYKKLKGVDFKDASWEHYVNYQKFFTKLGKKYCKYHDVLIDSKNNEVEVVKKYKKLDEALFEFGKFLKYFAR